MAFADDTTGGRIIKEGVRPVKITLAGTVKVGDLLGYSSGWKAADMNSSPKVYPELVAGGAGVSADVITAFREAVIDFGSDCTATAGDRVFASTDGGQYVGAASNDQGYCVGVMTTAQEAFISPFYAFPLLKLPNTEYSNTSGTVTFQQLKGALAATGTASMTGVEVAPKVLDGVAAATIRGVYVALDIEGTSAGTITNATAVEGNVGSDSGSGRTITTARCFYAVNNCHGTVTNGPCALRVDKAGGTAPWEAVIDLQGTESGLWSDTDTGSGDTEAGYIKVMVNDNARYIVLYSDAPGA
jgi:hypothetical protein